MKKNNRSWLAIAAVIILALCSAAFAATDHYAEGTKEYNGSNAADGDFVYGGKHNGNLTGSTKVTISGALMPEYVFGGGHAEGANTVASVNGSTEIIYNSTRTASGAVIGGGTMYEEGASADVYGNTNITFNNGGVSCDYGDLGNVLIAGGGRPSIGTSAKVTGDTNIVLNNCVVIASIDYNGSEGHIVGGGTGGDAADGSYDFSIGGDTNITLNGGTDAKIENVSVYGGSLIWDGAPSGGNVKGNSNINIVGANGFKMARGVITFCGTGKSATEHSGSIPAVLGTKTLKFENCGTGTLSSNITSFDVILLKGANNITFTKPLSDDVVKVKAEGTFADGTVILTLANGSYKPKIEGTNARWEGMKLVAGAEKETPAEPEKAIFEGDVNNVISKDVEAVAPAVSTDITAVETKLVSTDIKSSDLDTDASGQVILKKSVVVTAGGSYSDAYMLPIFTAAKTNPSADIVACSFAVKSSDLLAKTPQEVKLLKIKGKASTLSFKYSDKAEDFLKDGYFTIQTSGDNKIADKAAAFTADVYKVTMFIKDNGDYDLDPTAGSILDPSAIVKASESGSGGSSGGCSAGFAAIALLAIVPVVVRRKKQGTSK